MKIELMLIGLLMFSVPALSQRVVVYVPIPQMGGNQAGSVCILYEGEAKKFTPGFSVLTDVHMSGGMRACNYYFYGKKPSYYRMHFDSHLKEVAFVNAPLVIVKEEEDED